MPHDWIAVRGARVHNLKEVDVDIPRDKLVVITGLSGSGKSSLAFDTLYAEGQRRYVESLSAYARQFLEQMEKPDVDLIEGLSPAISIEQKTTGSNPRSTVGTVTEIYDYLRLLFANIGVPHCPNCGKEIASQSLDRIVDLVMTYPQDTRINMLAPIVRGRKGEFKKELQALARAASPRRASTVSSRSLEEDIRLDRRRNHTIEIVVDRLIVRSGIERRLAESVEVALGLAGDIVVIKSLDIGDRLFSRKLACIVCGISVPEMSPRAFSFNSPHGACPGARGWARRGISIRGGSFPTNRSRSSTARSRRGTRATSAGARGGRSDCAYYGIDPDVPFAKLPKKQRDLLLFGPPRRRTAVKAPTKRRTRDHGEDRRQKKADEPIRSAATSKACFPNLRRRFEEGSWAVQEELEQYRALANARRAAGSACGPRACRQGQGQDDRGYVNLPISRSAGGVRTSSSAIARHHRDAHPKEIQDRLQFLNDVGVGYLTLGRSAATLSGGEGQRIRLATQIGSNLTGVLYVLDEPSIGLHQRDNRKLLATLARLRDLGNTVVVVEHDEETIRMADYVIDLGPGAGELGGQVIFQGRPADLIAAGRTAR